MSSEKYQHNLSQPVDVNNHPGSKPIASRYDLIPVDMLRRLGLVFAEGCLVYGEDAWRENTEDPKWFRSRANHLEEHWYKFKTGDTSEDHLAKIIWGASVLMFCKRIILDPGGFGTTDHKANDWTEHEETEPIVESAQAPEPAAKFEVTSPHVGTNMSFAEAIVKATRGSTIRRTSWGPGVYVGVNPNGSIYITHVAYPDRQSLFIPGNVNLLAKDWEVLPARPGMSFSYAMQLARNGQKVRRRVWVQGVYVAFNLDRGIQCVHAPNFTQETYFPDENDIKEFDWEVYTPNANTPV